MLVCLCTQWTVHRHSNSGKSWRYTNAYKYVICCFLFAPWIFVGCHACVCVIVCNMISKDEKKQSRPMSMDCYADNNNTTSKECLNVVHVWIKRTTQQYLLLFQFEFNTRIYWLLTCDTDGIGQLFHVPTFRWMVNIRLMCYIIK